MPWQARIDAHGALHYIIVRGIERCKIFKDDADRESSVECFGKIRFSLIFFHRYD